MNTVHDPLHRTLLLRRDALKSLSLAACLPWALPWAVQAQGADFPNRPIKLIVPNAPGSSVDTIGRIVGGQLAAVAGMANFVDNKAGAAGALGVDAGKTAPPDGYTLIVASSSAMTVAPLLQKGVTYDPLKDFDFVSLVALLPSVLVCNPALKVESIADLIAFAKANPGKTNMASAGPGSASHLAGVALSVAAGFESLHVPYKGGSQSVASVVSGETHWTLTPAPAAMALVKGGRLRALGHSLAKGTRPLGSVPAIADSIAGFEYGSWIGLMAPKGLPPAVSDKLRKAWGVAMQQTSLREAFDANGAIPTASTAEDYRAMATRDMAQNQKVIQVAGLKAE
jgi:tripartite-type tricarboxylate transporter receptor subunit TctC